MKRTKKNTTASSVKAKAKAKAKIVAKVKEIAVRAKARQPRQSKNTKAGPSTTTETAQPPKVERLLEGVVALDKMTFAEQSKLIFDPLSGINPKYIVGYKETPEETK